MSRRAAFAAACALLATSAGCISFGPPDDVPSLRFYAIDPVVAETSRTAAGRRIALQPFTVPRRYEERIVHRLGADRIEFLEFDRWAESPEHGIERSVLAALGAGGRFGGAFDASVDVRADYALDGHVVRCDVVGNLASPQATLTLELLLSERATGTLLHSGVYSATLPVAGPGLDGVGTAMAACAAEAAAAAVTAWGKARLLD